MQRRIVGIETEFGITSVGGEGGRSLGADEIARYLFRPVVERWRSSNVFLDNGSRLYLDVGSHPEYATAECDGLRQLVAHDRAGERIVDELGQQAEQSLAEQGIDVKVYLFKNNTDSVGNSYGCHENYLLDRSTQVRSIGTTLLPFLVSRQLICGAGKILPGTPAGVGLDETRDPTFCFSQRAEHMWDGVSSATTRSRPLINTRDEPLADPARFRRLHVICGDSNLSEPSAALKVGSLLAVLDAFEAAVTGAGPALPELELADVGGSLRAVARDPRAVLRLASGRTMSAVDVQRAYLAATADSEIRRRWVRVLDALEAGAEKDLDGEIEWVTKRALLRRYAETRGLAWSDRRLAQVDLAFHDLGATPDGTPRGLYRLLEARGAAVRLTDPDAVERALIVPPHDTRALLRSRLIQAAQAGRHRYTADWALLTAHDLRLASGERGEVVVKLPDPLATADAAVDRAIEALGGAWTPTQV